MTKRQRFTGLERLHRALAELERPCDERHLTFEDWLKYEMCAEMIRRTITQWHRPLP